MNEKNEVPSDEFRLLHQVVECILNVHTKNKM